MNRQSGRAEIFLVAALLVLASCWWPARGQDKKEAPLEKIEFRECTPMVQIPGASDNSEHSTCVDKKGQRWELVLRSSGRRCEAILSARHDGYRHFLCNEQYELMLRPEKKAE